MAKAICTTCNHTQTTDHLGARLGGKLGLAAAGIMLGATVAKKNPLLPILFGVGGALLGHAVDTNVLPTCPSCRVALQLVDKFV
ncbi:hypothetical protein [Myxococcus sp. RHSTA-1-4]|uniref:hypothetical protein n=1 Tax=Myxococcus sp. RHSTA-1-4 TaxID=2874601 RepID=UPI001CBF4990|nr:hypothetical protein [Myxococcus sp. RHSTA-1-4]MBZ4419052.1 hypothetical protein [Myxococcus sp. RHSTA-1-4]